MDQIHFSDFTKKVDDCRYIEAYLLYHGAATIQKKKPANLINLHKQGRDLARVWDCCVKRIETQLGVKIKILRENPTGYLVLLYAEDLLTRRFSCQGSKEILERFDYPVAKNRLDLLIERLGDRFLEDPMPHEVGLFLGYPCRDVCQFIKKKGACAKSGALWKVYGNLRKAQIKLKRYQMAQKLMGNMLFQGRNVSECAQYFRSHSLAGVS
jgi:hypothetical protein